MKIINLTLLALIFILEGCTNANQSEENLKKLDKVYGYCDNPQRLITGRQYEVCKAREDSAGPDGEIGEGKSFSEIFSSITGDKPNKNGQVQVISAVNRDLWRGAMDVLSPYPIKNIDSNVGYIETDWIYDKSDTSRRCLIKVQINSVELIATGVTTKFTCQIKDGQDWYIDPQSYDNQSQKITLNILSKASEFNSLK